MEIPMQEVVRRLAQRIAQMEVDLAVKDAHIAMLEAERSTDAEPRAEGTAVR